MRSIALRNNLIRGGAALLASSAIVLAVAAPGSAATTPIAYADSNALNLSLLGSPISSGTVVATSDGKTNTVTGANTVPTIQALGNQNVIPSTAVLAQGAETHMSGLNGISSACGGLAGSGGGVVRVGDQETCKLTGAVSLNAGSVDLSKLSISNAGILSGLTGPIQAALQPLLTPALTAVSGVLKPIASALPVSVQLGAVNGQCMATPTTATGNATVAGLSVVVALPQPIGTITIPLKIATGKNVHVLTNLDQVVAAIQKGLVDTLDSNILGNGALSAVDTALKLLGTSVNQLLGTLNSNLIAVIAPQLKPLQDNILDGIINAQSSTPAPHPTISVTALDLKVLPVLGSKDVELRVGKIDCGPNYVATECVLHPTATQCQPAYCTAHPTAPQCHPTPPPSCQQKGTCPPPNKVTSGLAAGYLPTGPLGMALLGATVLAAAGAGVTAGARALRKSD